MSEDESTKTLDDIHSVLLEIGGVLIDIRELLSEPESEEE